MIHHPENSTKSNPLAAALVQALETERDPKLRQWIQRLLAKEEAAQEKRAVNGETARV